jgi:uncharacterized protein
MTSLLKKTWSPYFAGTAIGLLESFAMLTAKKPLGITTAFEHAAALAAKALAPRALGVDAYEKARGEEPKIGWESALVAGVVVGSMLSARLSEKKPPSAATEIRKGKVFNDAAALAGGALMMFGARMAKGCTSGHGISGSMQFSASSWLFTPIIFAVGAAVSNILAGRAE